MPGLELNRVSKMGTWGCPDEIVKLVGTLVELPTYLTQLFLVGPGDFTE